MRVVWLGTFAVLYGKESCRFRGIRVELRRSLELFTARVEWLSVQILSATLLIDSQDSFEPCREQSEYVSKTWSEAVKGVAAQLTNNKNRWKGK